MGPDFEQLGYIGAVCGIVVADGDTQRSKICGVGHGAVPFWQGIWTIFTGTSYHTADGLSRPYVRQIISRIVLQRGDLRGRIWPWNER